MAFRRASGALKGLPPRLRRTKTQEHFWRLRACYFKGLLVSDSPLAGVPVPSFITLAEGQPCGCPIPLLRILGYSIIIVMDAVSEVESGQIGESMLYVCRDFDERADAKSLQSELIQTRTWLNHMDYRPLSFRHVSEARMSG